MLVSQKLKVQFGEQSVDNALYVGIFGIISLIGFGLWGMKSYVDNIEDLDSREE